MRAPIAISLYDQMPTNIDASIDKIMEISGALGAALVDIETGVCLAARSKDLLDMELAAIANIMVVRAAKQVHEQLEYTGAFDNMLITFGEQLHLLHLSQKRHDLCFYLILDKEKGNIALTRITLKQVDERLTL